MPVLIVSDGFKRFSIQINVTGKIHIPRFNNAVFILFCTVAVREDLHLVDRRFPVIVPVQHDPVCNRVIYIGAAGDKVVLPKAAQFRFRADHGQVVLIRSVRAVFPAFHPDVNLFNIGGHPVVRPALLDIQGSTGGVQHTVLVLRRLQFRNAHLVTVRVPGIRQPGCPLPADRVHVPVIHLYFLVDILVPDNNDRVVRFPVKSLGRQAVIYVIVLNVEVPGAPGNDRERVGIVNIVISRRVIAKLYRFAVILPAGNVDVFSRTVIDGPPHHLQLNDHIALGLVLTRGGIQTLPAVAVIPVFKEFLLQVHLHITGQLVQDLNLPVIADIRVPRLLEVNQGTPVACIDDVTALIAFDHDREFIDQRIRPDMFVRGIPVGLGQRGFNNEIPVFFRQVYRAFPGPVVFVTQPDPRIVKSGIILIRLRISPACCRNIRQCEGSGRKILCLLDGNTHPLLGDPDGLHLGGHVGNRDHFFAVFIEFGVVRREIPLVSVIRNIVCSVIAEPQFSVFINTVGSLANRIVDQLRFSVLINRKLRQIRESPFLSGGILPDDKMIPCRCFIRQQPESGFPGEGIIIRKVRPVLFHDHRCRFSLVGDRCRAMVQVIPGHGHFAARCFVHGGQRFPVRDPAVLRHFAVYQFAEVHPGFLNAVGVSHPFLRGQFSVHILVQAFPVYLPVVFRLQRDGVNDLRFSVARLPFQHKLYRGGFQDIVRGSPVLVRGNVDHWHLGVDKGRVHRDVFAAFNGPAVICDLRFIVFRCVIVFRNDVFRTVRQIFNGQALVMLQFNGGRSVRKRQAAFPVFTAGSHHRIKGFLTRVPGQRHGKYEHLVLIDLLACHGLGDLQVRKGIQRVGKVNMLCPACFNDVFSVFSACLYSRIAFGIFSDRKYGSFRKLQGFLHFPVRQGEGCRTAAEGHRAVFPVRDRLSLRVCDGHGKRKFLCQVSGITGDLFGNDQVACHRIDIGIGHRQHGVFNVRGGDGRACLRVIAGGNVLFLHRVIIRLSVFIIDVQFTDNLCPVFRQAHRNGF